MFSQGRINVLSVKTVVCMAILLISSQSMAESRSDILERIRPVGQVTIKSQEVQAAPEVAAQPQPSPGKPAAPTEPVAKAEPAPVAAAPAPQPSASNGAALYAAKGCPDCNGADG